MCSNQACLTRGEIKWTKLAELHEKVSNNFVWMNINLWSIAERIPCLVRMFLTCCRRGISGAINDGIYWTHFIKSFLQSLSSADVSLQRLNFGKQ